jgi:hypothetical protein
MGKSRRKPPDSPEPVPVLPPEPEPTGLYHNRRLVYGTLIVLGSLMLLDAVPQYTLLHGKLRDWTDPVLDVTGLWQGSWELFAPTPDHVNVRIGAMMTWQSADNTYWLQPDWHRMTPLERSRHFRQMSYYDSLAKSADKTAWAEFCQHLANEKTANADNTLTSITLFEQRDVIAPPSQAWRTAYSEPQFSSQRVLLEWVPNAQ